MSSKWKELAAGLGRWRAVLLVAAVGLALLLWPSGQGTSGADDAEITEEARLEALLSEIEGVGEIEVLLSDSGAAVVCQGADSPAVCLDISQAVRCYTGLGADKVKIFKMKSSWREES